MKKLIYFCIFITGCVFLSGMFSILSAQHFSKMWRYLSPMPSAAYVSTETGLIFKAERPFVSGTVASNIRISVVGEKSGEHTGSIVLLDDQETIIFRPDCPFSPGESVMVCLDCGVPNVPALEYRFTVSEVEHYNSDVWAPFSDEAQLSNGAIPAQTQTPSMSVINGVENEAQLSKRAIPAQTKSPSMSVINGVAVPSDFPKILPTIIKGTANGRIFLGNWSWSGDKHYMMILENDGTPYFYKRLPGGHARDLKIQPTGTLTRRVYDDLNCFVEMDSQFVNIDTMRCNNGYGTDEHELQLTQNRHSFMIGLDYHQVDMSKLVNGGLTNATVIGNTVQEQDEHHNVVFEWRSWDNYSITDAVHENLRGGTIDYVHMNSIAIDFDSNIVVSSRHLSEVTKINRKTGKILWRLGGAHNQFTFTNDAYSISYQHDVRPVPGKPNAYTIMDNGNYHSPAFSRAVEFQLDTVAMTATKVWEYRHKPSDYYSYFMGNVQRLPNGNTYISWGDAPVPKATEVTPAGEVVYEANFVKSAYAYRSYRFEWESVAKAPYLVAESYSDKVTLIFNKFGDKRVKRYIVYAGLSPHPTTAIDSSTQTWIDLTKFSANQTYYFRVTARDSSDKESPYSNEENVLVKFIAPGSNFLVNGDFADGSNFWTFNARNGAVANGAVANGEYCIGIDNGGPQYSDIQLIQESFPLVNGKKYIFEFDARADSNRLIEPRVAQNGGAYTVYSKTSAMVITPVKKHYSYSFTMTDVSDNYARVVLNTGTSAIDCYFDNISVREDVGTDVGKTSVEGIREFSLNQNFPNPFNPTTTIRYQLPGNGISYVVSLQIFDMIGRNIATLENGEKISGRYQSQFDASRCASGLYYCRLTAKPVSGSSPFQATRKILLIK